MLVAMLCCPHSSMLTTILSSIFERELAGTAERFWDWWGLPQRPRRDTAMGVWGHASPGKF